MCSAGAMSRADPRRRIHERAPTHARRVRALVHAPPGARRPTSTDQAASRRAVMHAHRRESCVARPPLGQVAPRANAPTSRVCHGARSAAAVRRMHRDARVLRRVPRHTPRHMHLDELSGRCAAAEAQPSALRAQREARLTVCAAPASQGLRAPSTLSHREAQFSAYACVRIVTVGSARSLRHLCDSALCATRHRDAQLTGCAAPASCAAESRRSGGR